MRARRRRRRNRGLTILLGVIVAVFVVVAVAVGIKYLTGSLTSSDGKKSSSKSSKEKEETEEVLITGITLSMDRETVRAEEESQINVEITPANATNQKLQWTVSGGGGTVSDDGVFVPSKEAGKSTVDVTAKAADGSEVSASISVRVLEAIDPTQPMVAVTYDDGPNADTTPTVLDALEKNYAVATFFMQGVNIGGNEDLLKRSYAMGNELANHSWNHPQLTTLSSDEIQKQISDTDELIKAVCDEENPLLRPPYGSVNDTVKSLAGKPIIMWSLDTLDWKTRNTQSTYESCMTAKDGDIILMHDIHESTVAGAEQIITGLQEKGFQLVTVSELYKYRNGDFENGSIHYSMTAEEMLKNEAATATEDTTDVTATTEASGSTETSGSTESTDTASDEEETIDADDEALE